MPGYAVILGQAGLIALLLGLRLAAFRYLAADSSEQLSFLIGIGVAVCIVAIQHPFRRLAWIPVGWSLLLSATAFEPPYRTVMVGAGTILAALPDLFVVGQRPRTTRLLTRVDLLVLFASFALVDHYPHAGENYLSLYIPVAAARDDN